jgi:hypothetical protein
MTGRLTTTGNALWLVVLGALAGASVPFAGLLALAAAVCTLVAAAQWLLDQAPHQKKRLDRSSLSAIALGADWPLIQKKSSNSIRPAWSSACFGYAV